MPLLVENMTRLKEFAVFVRRNADACQRFLYLQEIAWCLQSYLDTIMDYLGNVRRENILTCHTLHPSSP